LPDNRNLNTRSAETNLASRVELEYPFTLSTSIAASRASIATPFVAGRNNLLNMFERPTTWLLGGRAVQLLSSVLLSGVVVRHFGLSMVGTYAIGYIAVAFIPHILSLGLNSELPRTRRPISELLFIAIVIQVVMLILITPGVLLFSTLMAASPIEWPTVFVVAMFGAFTGMFNVALTVNILLRHFRSAFFAPMVELVAILSGSHLAHSGLQMACFALVGKIATLILMWPRIRIARVALKDVLPTARQGSKYLLLDLVSTLSEQLIPFVLGISVPRAQLGLFRLCQQVSSAAETPGWSYVQSKYPELTVGDLAANKQIARRATAIGTAAAALCIVGSIPLAYVGFHTPVVALMMLVLGAALPWRYVSYVNDQRLRAVGRVGPTLGLAMARVFACAIALELAVPKFGVWAGIWTSGIASVVFGFVYQRTADAAERSRIVVRDVV